MARDHAFRSGRFWLPDAPDEAVGGWLDLSERRPRLTLADPLVPTMREVSRAISADGRTVITAVPTEEVEARDGLVIHGMLRGPSHRRVTLVGVSSAGRSEVIGGVVHDPGEQLFNAEYLLTGPHQSGSDSTFTMATLQLRHLDSWALLPGIAMEVTENWDRITARYERHEEESAQVTDDVRLCLGALVTLQEPTLYGAGFKRAAELRLEMPTGLTVNEWWQRFVNPISELLTMAVGAWCPPISLKLYREGSEAWNGLHHPLLEQSDVPALQQRHVFLTRKQLTLDHLAAWLNVSKSVAPIPALVADNISSPSRPLPSQLAEMAIAAEGLHRRLRPQDRVMTRSQKNGARRRATKAVSPSVRDRIREALGHIDAPSYAERLRHLTDLTLEAVPDATRPGGTGSAARWERRIKQVRNGFAHQDHRPDGDAQNDAEWREQVILMRTLYWVLVAALLMQAGLEASQFRARTLTYDPYQALMRNAKLWVPEVYAPGAVDDLEPLSHQAETIGSVRRMAGQLPDVVGWRWRQ